MTRSLALLLLLAALLGTAAQAQTAPSAPAADAKAAEPPAAPLSIVALAITPDQPGPDTLCQLRVKLKNTGDQIASQLGFRVTVNGVELPVYRNQLFMQRVDPGKTVELRLYNFWSTETSRPVPADGKYRVEVTLREAQWYKIGDDAGTEVWDPLGAVPGLPQSATVSVGR